MTVPVSIVVPVFNGRTHLETLMDSIRRQTAQPLEVIVVDNGSSDGAPEIARRLGARVLVMGRNAGFAAAVNRGIGDAKGEAIALINCDVELDARWLETLWQGACESGADFVTGTIVRVNSPEIIDGLYDLVSRGGCAWRAGAGRPLATAPGIQQPIWFCSATAALYRAELFQKIGVFEESFESYLEDVDFGLRCALAGRTGRYIPAAICRHHGSATFGPWNRRMVRLISRNQVFLVARHYPGKLLWRWLWPILVGQTLWGFVAVRHGRTFAWLRGKMEGLRRFREIRRASSRSANLSTTIEASDREIFELQSRTGFDSFWKLYFLLAPGRKSSQ
jgi:GT2 family glycosyltransferase